jgi:polysaccharide export outer membrane protein
MNTAGWSILLSVLLGSTFPGRAGLQDQAAPPTLDRFVSEYRIGARDLLEIKVQEDAKLNTTVRVSEDGKINLPLVGEVLVEGNTGRELEKLLAQKFEAWYQNPHVFVTIREHQSKQVSVQGAVTRQGFVQLQGRMTLLEAITAAGGLTREAALEMIIFRQAPDGSALNLHIPIDDLMIKGDPKYNIPLESGDNIVVQVDRLIQIFIYGAVRNPGALSVYKSRIPTLRQAVAQAGGFTERASKKNVVVTRRDANGNEKRTTVNIKDIESGKKRDFQLEENDTVYVKESWF